MKELQPTADEYAHMSEFQKRLRIRLKDDLAKMPAKQADRLVLELMAWAEYLIDCYQKDQLRSESSSSETSNGSSPSSSL